jgi:hypothetical protein
MRKCQLTAHPSPTLTTLISAISPIARLHISDNVNQALFMNLESNLLLATLLLKDAFIYQILHFLDLDRTYT